MIIMLVILDCGLLSFSLDSAYSTTIGGGVFFTKKFQITDFFTSLFFNIYEIAQEFETQNDRSHQHLAL